MKKLIGIFAASLIVALVVVGCSGNPTGQGWTTLIDGENGMDNWGQSGSVGNWRAEGGAIQADKFVSGGKVASVLVSKRSFKDFELRVEFWAGEDTNSGVYLRAPNPEQVNTASGAYEVQIWDKNPNPKYATGSLVNVAAVEPIHKAANKWNTFEIVAKGTQITVKMNGVVTVNIQDAKNTQVGRLGLQFNGGPIKVRKFQVKEL